MKSNNICNFIQTIDPVPVSKRHHSKRVLCFSESCVKYLRHYNMHCKIQYFIHLSYGFFQRAETVARPI